MKFYIAENGKPAGPFEANELLAHGLTVNSQVWNESMDGWQRASAVPELMALLNNQQMIQTQQQQPVQPVQQQPEPAQQYQAPTGYETTPNPDAQYQQPQSQYQQQQPQYQQPQSQYQPQQPQYQQPQYQQPQYQQPQQQQWAQPQYQQPMAAPPKDWKVESIILTSLSALGCCNLLSLICGIVGIVNAGKVRSAFYRGDIIGAEQSASSAKTWTLVGIALLVIGAIARALSLMTSPDFISALSEFENV